MVQRRITCLNKPRKSGIINLLSLPPSVYVCFSVCVHVETGLSHPSCIKCASFIAFRGNMQASSHKHNIHTHDYQMQTFVTSFTHIFTCKQLHYTTLQLRCGVMLLICTSYHTDMSMSLFSLTDACFLPQWYLWRVWLCRRKYSFKRKLLKFLWNVVRNSQ